MAIINSRNESNKFIKQVGSEFIHKPSDVLEDITNEILNVSSDLTFNVFSDENCNTLVGNFQILFKDNDGVYLKLSDLNDCKLYGDSNFGEFITISGNIEEKLLEWGNLNSSTVINTSLSLL